MFCKQSKKNSLIKLSPPPSLTKVFSYMYIIMLCSIFFLHYLAPQCTPLICIYLNVGSCLSFYFHALLSWQTTNREVPLLDDRKWPWCLCLCPETLGCSGCEKCFFFSPLCTLFECILKYNPGFIGAQKATSAANTWLFSTRIDLFFPFFGKNSLFGLLNVRQLCQNWTFLDCLFFGWVFWPEDPNLN